jgi:hypothetical protein
LLLLLFLAGCDECAGEQRQENCRAGEADHYSPFLRAWDILPRRGRFGCRVRLFSDGVRGEVGGVASKPPPFKKRRVGHPIAVISRPDESLACDSCVFLRARLAGALACFV